MVSVGVKVAESVCVPALSVVPEVGEYANDPGTLVVASSWVPLNAVPYVMAAGVAQVMVGVLGEGNGGFELLPPPELPQPVMDTRRTQKANRLAKDARFLMVSKIA